MVDARRHTSGDRRGRREPSRSLPLAPTLDAAREASIELPEHAASISIGPMTRKSFVGC